MNAADGSKLKKTVTEGTTNKTVDYLDGYQYRNNLLSFFPTVEGYVRSVAIGIGGAPNYSFHYVYNYTDHLGNIRLRYTKDPQTGVLEILEENQYYPFGLKHENYNSEHQIIDIGEPTGKITLIPVTPNLGDSYQYRFGGMEQQTELGLEFYDFGARNYDPAIGRWMNVDPMAEMMRRYSPYNYAFDNPVFWIDPDGMAPYANTKISSSKTTNASNKGSDSGGKNPAQQDPQFPHTSGEQKLDAVHIVIDSSAKKNNRNSEGSGSDIYGFGTEDRGRKGKSDGSIDLREFPMGTSGGQKTTGFMQLIRDLIEMLNWYKSVPEANDKSETTPSSMEKEMEEPEKDKLIPAKVVEPYDGVRNDCSSCGYGYYRLKDTLINPNSIDKIKLDSMNIARKQIGLENAKIKRDSLRKIGIN